MPRRLESSQAKQGSVMHFVSKVDGLDYVVVLDGFGLSSWCLPDEVVSEPDIHGSSNGLLSTDGAGRLVLAWDDNYDRSHLVEVDTLEREARYSRFQLKPSILDATGEMLLRVVDPRAPAVIEHLDQKGEVVASRPLPFPDEEPVKLSTAWATPLWTRPRYAGRAGLVAVLGADGRVLLTDLRDFNAPRVIAFAKLWVPRTWDVQLTPFDDALGIIAHDIPRGTATTWVVSGREVLEKKDIAALTMPTFATKDVLLTQVDAGTLRRVPLRGGEALTFRLPASGRETGLEAHGPGTPIAGGDVTAFLPWHHESLILFDAETGEPSEVSRLLPEDLGELRQVLMRHVRKANEAARSTGTRFALKALDVTPKHKRYGVVLSAHGGDGGFRARAVNAAFQDLYPELQGQDFGGWTIGVMGHSLIDEQPHAPVSADELASVLGHMEHHGFRLTSLAPVIERLYAHNLPAHWSIGGGKLPLEDDAALLLLQAFMEGLASPAPVGVAAHLGRWRQSPMSVFELAARVPRLHPSHARNDGRLLVALAQLAANHLHHRAGTFLTALTNDAPPQLLDNARHGITEIHRWWAQRHKGGTP
ncbi:hypothetical protein JY651_26120 [Pyxidicoccus parkwayensis]|uniref:Uncharacterized protein n=1 Tax=Pyxidicoccus parkwayensis TaxID=2813578 RepID=A0ABX7NJ00_9BACT|nr:hypothetical protein [Pyxidicoccus parkwaysis]QSQ18837.1 hypothetical protein JY651_26120 [Pyxidicoccus parkwaysis]